MLTSLWLVGTKRKSKVSMRCLFTDLHTKIKLKTTQVKKNEEMFGYVLEEKLRRLQRSVHSKH